MHPPRSKKIPSTKGRRWPSNFKGRREGVLPPIILCTCWTFIARRRDIGGRLSKKLPYRRASHVASLAANHTWRVAPMREKTRPRDILRRGNCQQRTNCQLDCRPLVNDHSVEELALREGSEGLEDGLKSIEGSSFPNRNSRKTPHQGASIQTRSPSSSRTWLEVSWSLVGAV